MHVKSWSAASLLGVLVLALSPACVGGGDGGPDAPDARWEPAFDTSQAHALFSVWGSAPDDVYIVGGTDTMAEIYHYDGRDWSPMDAPDVAALIWLFGFGADDIYAVGLQGAVVHYDGQAWSVLQSGTDQDLWGIFGKSHDEMYLVGGDPEGEAPVMLRYDGESFTQVVLDPEQNVRGARALFKVFGVGDALFAVGQRGQIFRQVDGEWVNSPAGAAADQDFVSLWGLSDDRLVAVGGRSNARIATFDGERWTTRGESGLGGLNAVHMTEPSFAMIGGVNGFVGRYDVERDAIIAEDQDVTSLDIHAMWSDGAGRTYAVGGEFLPPYEGAALVRMASE